MKLHKQMAFAGNCAQLSLVHALEVLGVRISVSEAHRRTGVSRWEAMNEGSDEHDLMKGIRASRCIPLSHLCHSSERARMIITRYLCQGIPVIILVSDQAHWMVLSGIDQKDRISWIDSTDDDLTGHNSWKRVASWMRYREDDEGCYYFIGVKPKERPFDFGLSSFLSC